MFLRRQEITAQMCSSDTAGPAEAVPGDPRGRRWPRAGRSLPTLAGRIRRNKEELREEGGNIASHIPPNSPCNLKINVEKRTTNKVTFSRVFYLSFYFSRS